MTAPNRNNSVWRNKRRRALKQAQADGLTHCPICKITLDYTRSQRPNSPELDHIIPYAQAQSHNVPTRIICRRCNQSLGGKLGRSKQLGTQKQTVNTIDF